MKTYIVDAFTNTPYTGNPAGVCLLQEPLDEATMFKIAAEINLSETAFLYKKGELYSLRWFTPTVEVDLCGHATLSAAHILFETGEFPKDQVIRFETKSGILTASYKNNLIELDFPQLHVTACESNSLLEKAFGIKPLYIGKNHQRYLIEIENIKELTQIKPDFQLLQQSDLGCFMITVKSNDQYDFHSRFFAPGVGVPEDPVTGSMHCYLAPYWAKKLNKKKLQAYQASSRSGSMECEISDDSRVFLRGQAITMNEMKMPWVV